jgi:hypothetical protein
MKIKVYFTPLFSRKYKRYLKKYNSLENDLKQFIENLDNTEAIDVGGAIYKYRLKVKSKNKGKSGGFRIITFELLISENEKDITLITIYDKSEQPSISKTEIIKILKAENLL